MKWDWGYRSAPRRAPPKDGIKVKKLGSTWWGRNWIEALERSSRDYLSRLGRGRTYARAGSVSKLHVAPGEVAAQVTGSRPTPYKVKLLIKAFPASHWQRIIAALAKEARYAADLLAGHMPEDIDAVFKKCGHSLFPLKSSDIETDCSCPDWANPCKHVAAVHYVLGEAFDKDPFLLFELRGCTKDAVLQALSSLRSDATAPEPSARGGQTAVSAQEAVHDAIEISAFAPAQYEQPPKPMPALRFSFDTPEPPAAILRSAGTPPGWSEEQSAEVFFDELYARAAKLAREWALEAPPEEPQEEPSVSRIKAKRKSSRKRPAG